MRSAMAVKVTAACAVGMLVGAASGCDGDQSGEGGGGTTVVTGVYPFEWLASQVGGDHVDVDNLTDPGVDPHNLELSPRQIGQASEADVAFYVSGLQPAVDDAIGQEGGDNALDVADLVDLLPAGADHDHEDAENGGGHDPHMWLDTERLSQAADGLAERLAEVDPDNANDYRVNAEATAERLTDMDGTFASTLEDCESRDIVVDHAAFGYLAEKYSLNQISVNGIDSDSEPSPARIAEVVDLVEEHDVTTVFTETLAPPEAAETIADEAGVDTAVLDPIEGIADESLGDDYPSIMRANLETLRTALRCS